MINVTEKIIVAIKSEKSNQRDADLVVLRELKTKLKDYKEETLDVQYKIVKKMLSDRQKSLEIYQSNNRNDLAEKEKMEITMISSLVEELEKHLPKMMSAEDIQMHLDKIKQEQGKIEMRTVMAHFKDLQADKGLVSKMAKQMM